MPKKMTNYEEHFGTPERVMESLDDMSGMCPIRAFGRIEHCCDCDGDECSCNRAILEWLKKECE